MFMERREHLISMKNRFLTKYLCITLISAMVLGNSVAVFAEGDTLTSDNTINGDELSDTPGPSFPSEAPSPDTGLEGDGGTISQEPTSAPEQPVPSPEEPSPSPVEPSPTEPPQVTPIPSPTPEPGEPDVPSDVTPTPAPSETPTPDPIISPTPEPTIHPTETPLPVLTEKAKNVIKMINALMGVRITLDHKSSIMEIRTAYNDLTAEEKRMITNYQDFVEMEKALSQLEVEELLGDGDGEELSDGKDAASGTSAIIGTPVYFTSMVSNLHAGKEFYLNSLKKNYQLSFSDDFSAVMDEIEKEYKEKNKLVDVSEMLNSSTSTSADCLLVRNWQDILAIYIYQHRNDNKSTYVMDSSCKEELAEIFAEMNPIVRDKSDITKVSYGNRHINYYIKKNKIAKEDRALLKKYVETDCKLLCAVVTGAKGFVRQSVGDDVSEERINVITAAYSLVGKVGYFWGGKSIALGMDPSWGGAARVTEPGSTSTGTLRAFGLDCSGFVTWAAINGYQNQGMLSAVGTGTSEQWELANVVKEADAQPGDLVFQRGPEAGSDNHVGILCGKTEAGDWIAVHCSSSKNGVTVGEAYGAGFRYIRQPSFYPTKDELIAMEQQNAVSGTLESARNNVTLTGNLQNAVSSKNTVFGSVPENNSITKKVLVDNSTVEPF